MRKGDDVSPNKEAVNYGRSIGKYFDTRTGQYYNTTRATGHYDSKRSAHIVPDPPTGFKR